MLYKSYNDEYRWSKPFLLEHIAEEFSVNLMTIQRDLNALQQQGWLRKVHLGATAQPSALFHLDTF
ncbi:MAG: DeoR family transcriptional regulator [Ktedonobacteraceae bacterium]